MTAPALEGRRALVVGGGSGIGRAVVDAFMAEGASVGVLEIDAAKCKELRRTLPRAPIIEGDASTLDTNRVAVDTVVDALGGLDVLVSCVGLYDFKRGIAELPDDEIEAAFDELFRVNVASPLLSVKAALPALRASRGCAILTASTSSFVAGRGGVLYVASKFAIRGLVAALASELAPEVRVNAVAPGATVSTDLRGPRALGLEDASLGDRPGRAEEVLTRSPLGVAMTAADHAASYVFLASSGALGISGSCIHSDGGAGVAP